MSTVLTRLSYALNVYFGIIVTLAFSHILLSGSFLVIEPNRIVALIEWYMSVSLILFGIYGLFRKGNEAVEE